MPLEIHFVCTGNICRSPMAEGLLRRALEQHGCDDIRVTSSGTWAYAGREAMPEAIEAARARGVDLNPHGATATDADTLKRADLIVAMTSVHEREVLELLPEAADKLVLLKEIAEIEPERSDGAGSLEGRLRGFLAGERPTRRRSLDVDDPMGLPAHVYERCAGELEAGVDALVDILCAPG